MKFIEVCKGIQAKNEGYLVYVRSGIFFIGIGRNAIILEKEFKLKPICISEKICKCVFPLSSMDKYIMKLASKRYNFVLYEYSPKELLDRNYKELFRYSGGNKTVFYENCLNCEECWYNKMKTENSLENKIKKIKEEFSENG